MGEQTNEPEVLFVCGSLPPIKCGVGFYCNALIGELTKGGLIFDIVKTRGTNVEARAKSVLDVDGWEVWRVPRIVKFIKGSQAAIVHVQYPAVGYKRSLGINLLPYALRIFTPSKKIVVTLHEYHDSPFLGRARNFITALPTHKLIVSNELDRSHLPRMIARKSVVIPIGSSIAVNGINKAEFNKLVVGLGLNPQKPTIVFFGFAHPSKNIDQVIGAIESLPDFQLLVITALDKSNEHHEQLLEGIQASKAKSRIGITGFLEDELVSIILLNCKYFVLPQSMPVTAKSSSAIAAICHGNILITTGDNSSVPFVDSQNAIFLKEPTAEQIVEKIHQLESDEKLRNTVKGGAEILSKYFSWSKITDNHKNLYEKLQKG